MDPSHTNPLLLSKLRPPRPGPALIERARLMTLLDQALEHTLTLVAAPAGFGKTTLLQQWLAEHQKAVDFPPVAWVSLNIRARDE